MSMFYELMMRKKEQIMYATIKGSLTNNNDVFSGFSDSNYLTLQQPFKVNQDTIAEIKFKVNFSFLDAYTSNVIVGYPNSYNIQINCIGTQPKLHLFIGNDNSWNLLNNIIGITTISVNTDYFIKLVFNKNNVKLLLSTDNINWTTEIDENITLTEEYIYNLCIGKGRSESQYLRGSIDLNNSYIKLGSTKYNLQAVVGYTIVGSPTITDGVVSGFSANNYLQTSSSYTTNNMNNDNYEFCVKLTPASSMGSECYAIKYYNGSTVKGLGINNNKLAWSVGYPTTSGHKGTILSSFTVTKNTTYWLKGIYKNKIASLYYSLDGTNYTLIESIDETDQTFKITSAFNFGATANSSYGLFQGSIDMKETYIKINNKLWFNGQEG